MTFILTMGLIFLALISYAMWDDQQKMAAKIQNNYDALNTKYNRLCERINMLEFRPDGSDSIFEDGCEAITVDLEEEWI